MLQIFVKDTAFFDLFEKSAANVHEGACLLEALLGDYRDVAARTAKIKDVEHVGDTLTHQTIEKLNGTFITPLDREDIHELVCRLDDVLDLIDTATARMGLYKIDKPTEDARALAKVLVVATAIIMDAMKDLRTNQLQSILKRCIEIHTQENEGDRIEQHALGALFENGQSAIDVIKWKDIYENLEAATDRCEDVANVLEGIVLKNA